MNREDIINMAREAGFTNPEKFTTTDANLQGILSDFWENLDRLATLVAAAEREACAKVCDEIANKPSNVVLGVALDCAAAIRVRREE